MRIVEDSPGRLVLRDRTLWVSIVCWAAALVITPFALARHEPTALISAALCAAFGVAFFRSSDVVFDKVARSCTIQRRDMWKLSRTVVPFDQIKNVLVQQMIDHDSSNVATCRLSLATADSEIPLSSSYEPDLERFETMRSRIAETVFGQGRAPAAVDPVRALVSAGRTIEAVALLRRQERLSLEEAMQRVRTLQEKETPQA
jgi:hypothetical protein